MIFDRIENSGLYFPEESLFTNGFIFINKALADNQPDGRYELTGGAYAMIQTYVTAPSADKKPESHGKYADIQTLLSGVEAIGWQPIDGLEIDKPYNAENDIAFYKNTGGESPLLLKPGLFGIFYPNDAHKPGCCVGEPTEVRKLVVKIPV